MNKQKYGISYGFLSNYALNSSLYLDFATNRHSLARINYGHIKNIPIIDLPKNKFSEIMVFQ